MMPDAERRCGTVHCHTHALFGNPACLSLRVSATCKHEPFLHSWYDEGMSNATMTAGSRSVKASAVACARVELKKHGTDAEKSREILHDVGLFMNTQGFEPVADIIISMHRLNRKIGHYVEYVKHPGADGYGGNFAPVVPALDALTDDFIRVIADAGKHHWTVDHTLTMIGSSMLNPAHGGTEAARSREPFPWDENDARKAALAIPEAAGLDCILFSWEVDWVGAGTNAEMNQKISPGDVPAVFPVAISKGLDPKMLAVYPDLKSVMDIQMPLMRMLLRLRGDWRQGIYDYIFKDRNGERLLSYLQVNPATYGADWILAIINHINDHDLDKASILNDDYAMRMIVTAHSESRYDHPSENAEDGMHARYFDVGNVSTVRIAHDKGGIISGLEVTAGRETDPAALETVFRILDAMDKRMERKFVKNMHDIDSAEAAMLIRRAVHDMARLPMDYITETLVAQMDAMVASRM